MAVEGIIIELGSTDQIDVDIGSTEHIEGGPGEVKFLPGPPGPQGETGETGATGVSVTDISVERTSGTGAAGTTDTYTGTVTFSSGSPTTFTFEVYNGEDGQDGAAATIAVGNVSSGSTAAVTNSGTSSAAVFDFTLPKGDKGDTGNTGAQGVSVSSVSVARTSGTGAAGTTDTYTGTVTFSNSTTSTFTFSVYNGADGQGAGDMLKSVYDTDNDGVVDDAEKLGGQSPDYYAKATNGIYYAKTAGTGVAQVATISGITQYYDGLCVALIFNVATRSDATININNLGAVPLRENTDTEGAAGNESIYSPGGAMRVFVYDADNALFRGVYDYSTYARIHMVATEGSNAAKQADKISHNSNYFQAPCYQLVYFNFDNTAQSALTLTLWTGPFYWAAAPIYINGEASSATNYTLPKGLYLVLWDGTNYYVNTNGTLPGTQAPLTFDSTPTQNSDNPVTSGGVYDALAPLRTVDSTPTEDSTNLVESGGVYDALAPLRSVDATPTASSTNLVQSGGVASAVSAVQNTVSRRNLLDNAYFVGGGSQQSGGGRFPINQRGQTSYSGTGYGIDRWKTTHSSFGQELQADCLRWKCNTAISSGNTIYAYFYPTTPLPAGTYTLSFLVKGLDGGGNWYFSSGSGGYSMGNIAMSVGLVSKTFVATGSETSPSFYLWHQNALAVNGYLDIIAAKLEVGATQTLAHQDNGVWVLNDIPNFAEELAKCQYRLYPLKSGEPIYGRRSIGSASYAVFRAPTIMRTTPTATKVGGSIVIYGQNGNQYGFGSFNNQWVNFNGFGVNLSQNATYAGEPLEMFCQDGIIFLSAEE